MKHHQSTPISKPIHPSKPPTHHQSNSPYASRRPRCRHKDKRYCRNEHSIQRVVQRALARRDINLRASDICRSAKISTPTFYTHYKNSNDALHDYERTLLHEFQSNTHLSTNRREVIFLSILTFIKRHQPYFESTLLHGNVWLLAHLFFSLKSSLAPPQTTRQSYTLYVTTIIGFIYCWGQYDHFSNQSLPHYLTIITRLRLMHFDI